MHDLLSFKILPVIVLWHIKQLNHFAYRINNVFKLSFFISIILNFRLVNRW